MTTDDSTENSTMDSIIQDYRAKVGVAFFGGGGENNLRLTVDGCDPKLYPDFYMFGANTDAKVAQLHFGKQEDPNKDRWGNALTIHQLGGNTITKGRGAGGRPEKGREAAETEESQAAMRKFFENVDELLLVGAVGGGTGTGALPVAARLAKEMGKSTLAIVILPEPDEGRNKKANTALKEIQELVPTIAIRNAYLKEFMSTMSAEDRANLTFKDAWNLVNQNSIVPMLLIIREILQVTGDIINFDQADWEAMLSCGKHVFFGLADGEKNKSEVTTAEEIVEELFAGRFQDTGLIEQGKVIGLWAHGPWKKEKTSQIVRLIKQRVCAKNPSMIDDMETHIGIVHEVTDGKMWMALIIVAESAGDSTLEIKPQREAEPKKSSGLSMVARQGVSSENTIRLLKFRSGEKNHESGVPAELEIRYKSMLSDKGATEESATKICEEVETWTGKRPDLPSRFTKQPAPVTEQARSSWFRWPSDKASIG
ncbi:hypothetical protein H0W91_01735 [Patescibacteria group bacterium]|nr:hypothetical protein [Patescibacteria group bacterium]